MAKSQPEITTTESHVKQRIMRLKQIGFEDGGDNLNLESAKISFSKSDLSGMSDVEFSRKWIALNKLKVNQQIAKSFDKQSSALADKIKAMEASKVEKKPELGFVKKLITENNLKIKQQQAGQLASRQNALTNKIQAFKNEISREITSSGSKSGTPVKKAKPAAKKKVKGTK